MPLPSTSVFHPQWAEQVAPVSESAMNVVVQITSGSTGGGWDPETGPTEGSPVVVYSCPASIVYPATQAREADAASQEITVRRADITLPRDSTTQSAGARVKVLATTSENAPVELVGRTYEVQSVSWSSHTWEQLLECTDDQSNQEA